MEPELFSLYKEEPGGLRSGSSGTQWSRSLTLRLVCQLVDVLMQEDAKMDQLEGQDLRGGPVSAADVAAWRRWASTAHRKRMKRRKKEKLPKASSSCGRPVITQAQAPAVLATREREGAQFSVHRQTLALPVAPQRQVRTVQTVQVTGESRQCKRLEVVDVPMNTQR